MTLNHKELFLSPSGKISYNLKGVTVGSVNSVNSTSFETGAITAPGFRVGTAPSNRDWVMVAPMGDLGESHTCLNGARVTADNTIAISFGNWGVGAPANETLNNNVQFPFLALGIFPPEIIVEGNPPVQKSDFRKSPSGKLIMCYEKISAPPFTLTPDAANIQQLPSECASFKTLPGPTFVADYIFAFPLVQGLTVPVVSSYAFNYACVSQDKFIDLHFISPPGGAVITVATDWLFLIIKNDGSLGTATGGV